MEDLVIIVTEPRGVMLPECKPNASPRPEEQRGLMLLPGENNVSPGYWDEVKKNPAVRIWLKAGILRNKGKGVAVPIVTDWDKVKLDKAKIMISRIDDLKRLQEIKAGTKKKGLKSICEDRIEKLLDATEKANG